jgi:FMN phosphatase YigB (HAD superfamily)
MHSPREATLRELIDDYDVFFVDQFGVLRDDNGPYDGAIEALSQIKAAGKTVVILSNSGRSGDFNADRLVKIGFAADGFDYLDPPPPCPRTRSALQCLAAATATWLTDWD